MTYTTIKHNVICQTCGKIVAPDYDIGEYGYTWQFMTCECGGVAIPDLANPIEHEYGATHRCNCYIQEIESQKG